MESSAWLTTQVYYVFMYNKDLHRIEECKIGQRVLSHHAGVHVTMHLEGRRRKTLWRLNSGMSNDASFVSVMKGELGIYLQENDNGTVNPSMLWDASKAVLRSKIIAWSALLKKVKAKQLSNLEEKLKYLKKKTHITNRDPVIIKQIRFIKQDIDKILSEEVEKKT